MSAPRKIWLQEPVGLPGEEERSWCVEPQSDADDLYHHDDVVRELVDALEGALNHSFIGLNSEYTRRARAAVAKIAQEGKR